MSFKEAKNVSKQTNEEQGKAHCLVIKRKHPRSGVYLWYKQSEEEMAFQPSGGILLTNFRDRMLPVPSWQATREPKLTKLQKIADNPRLLCGGAVYGKTHPERASWLSLARRVETLQVFDSIYVFYLIRMRHIVSKCRTYVH